MHRAVVSEIRLYFMSGFGASLRCWLLHTAQHRWAGSAARAARSRGALTVRDGAIEIDSREAVSRFLNVHGKSGGQSVSFYTRTGNWEDLQTRLPIGWG